MCVQQISRAVLVGHGMGGKVAQAVVLLTPERVDGRVVLDMAPVVSTTARDAHWKAVVDILHVLASIRSSAANPLDKKKVEVLVQPVIPDPALRAFLLTNWDTARNQWKIPMQDIVASIDQLANFDVPLSHSYEGDCVLIHGGGSRGLYDSRTWTGLPSSFRITC
jgi:esterase